MSYRVELADSRKKMNDFLALPEAIYKDDPNYIVPVRSELRRILDKKRNPYFQSANLMIYICYRDNQAVARAVVVINYDYWNRWNEKTAFFGFFESVNEPGAACALFERIGNYCLNAGVETIKGPFNPNHYSEMGLLIQNFDSPPAFFETYNPPYYKGLLETCGFIQEKIIHSRINRHSSDWCKLHSTRIQVPGQWKDYTIRFLKIWKLKKELEVIRSINNDAFSDNPYFMPLSSHEYRFAAKFMFLVTRPKWVAIIEHKNQPVGMVQLVYNINPILKNHHGRLTIFDLPSFLLWREKLGEAIIFSCGIRKEFRNSPISLLIYQFICEIGKTANTLYTTWMSDENHTATQSTEKLGLTPYKWFAIYQKTLVN